MSHQLPDDMQQWPNDPYELLGIAVDADEKSIKRAYFGLLKTIDVDNEPAKFQLIQEAYEAAKSGTRRVVDDQMPPAAEVKNVSNTSITRQDVSSFTPVKNVNKESESTSSNESLGEVWRLLKDGNATAAEKLIERLDCLDFTGVGLALYAVQRAQAQRDDPIKAGQRVKLIMKLIDDSHSHDYALHYLRHEFLANAELANLPVFEDYLAASNFFEHRFEIAALRWQALGLNDPAMVASDLEELSRQEFDFGDRWPFVVALAMEYTVWSDDAGLESHKKQCGQWLAEDFSDFSDRADEIKFAAEELIDNPMAWSHPLSLLVRLAATGFEENHLAVWESLAKDISNSRRNGLRNLDSLFRNYPYSMSMVQSGLARYSRHQGKTWRSMENEQDVLASQMQCVLRRFGSAWYPDSRETILQLSIKNFVSISFFGRLLDRFLPEDHVRTWTAEIEDDQALHCAAIAAYISY